MVPAILMLVTTIGAFVLQIQGALTRVDAVSGATPLVLASQGNEYVAGAHRPGIRAQTGKLPPCRRWAQARTAHRAS